MAKTDLSSSSKPHVHTWVSLRAPLRCGFSVVLCSCLLFGATRCRAQETQDVAEAARQERARKEQERKSQHVYTDEDLRRAKILTAEDEARIAAQRKQQPAPFDAQNQTPLDTGSVPQLPLGDIARLYRAAKLAAQESPQFHLPFDEPVFAAPMISLPVLAPPRPSLSPARPKLVPAHPRAAVAPALSNPAPLRRVDPFTRRLAPPAPVISHAAPEAAPVSRAVAPRVFSNPAPKTVSPNRSDAAPQPPAISRALLPPAISNPAPKVAPPAISHAAPKAVQPSIAPAMAPAVVTKPANTLHTVTVQPGDSLWKLALQNLGRGSRWRDLLAANPAVVDANRLVAGTQIVVPAKVATLRTLESDLRIAVEKGDTLSKIAQVRYGQGTAWRCILKANPEITDANRIYEGQQLLLPFACQP